MYLQDVLRLALKVGREMYLRAPKSACQPQRTLYGPDFDVQPFGEQIEDSVHIVHEVAVPEDIVAIVIALYQRADTINVNNLIRHHVGVY